jgi:HK97 family phage portal protein
MQLISTSGSAVPVRERGWPLAGLDTPMPRSNANTLIQLAMGAGGVPNYATFYMIYRTNPWIYATVQAYANALSRLPIFVYQIDAAGVHRRVRGDLPGVNGRPSAGMALDNLLRMPEPGVSKNEWIRKLVIDWMVYGNAIAQVDRGPSGVGVPQSLWHVPWRRVSVIPGETVPVVGYKVQGQIDSKVLPADSVIHLGRGSDIDAPLGMSFIEPLRYTVALHDALQRHLNAYFSNAMRPSGHLAVEKGTPKEAIKLIQEQVTALYSSPEQAGKILVSTGEFKSMADEPQAANIIELAKLSREEIAAAGQVPPPILGILERAIHANVTELRSQFLRDVIGPKSDEFMAAICAQLIGQNPQWNGYFTAFDMNHALRPDLAARAEVYKNMRHVWTPNEMRQMEGEPPLVGEAGAYADTVWMPSGEVPLGLPQPQVEGGGGPGTDGGTPGDGGADPLTDPGQPDPAIDPGDVEGDIP